MQNRTATSDEPDGLPSLVEPERASPAHLDPVVGGTDGAGDDDGSEHEQCRPSERSRSPDVPEEVAGDDRDQDGDTAHRRRAGLEGVMRGPVDADLLADPPTDEPAQQYRRPEARHQDRHRTGGKQRDHPPAPATLQSRQLLDDDARGR